MPADPKPPLSDEALDRLARDWFADARARTCQNEAAARRELPAERTAGDDGGGLLDWLFGDDADDDGACDDGGGDGE